VTGPGAGLYTLRRVEELLGLSRRVVAGLVAEGFVKPSRGPRNEFRFSFQDLLVLRTAHELREKQIPPRKIVRALKQLRAKLPNEMPLTGLRLTAVGTDVAVRDRDGLRGAETGQLLFDFEIAPERGDVRFLDADADAAADDRDEVFAQAESLEPIDGSLAEAAYRRVLELDPQHLHAFINLGALLCEAGRPAEAVTLFDTAIARGLRDPLIHYNRAIALEDRGDARGAIASYLRALELDTGLADAHFNLARLYEEAGDAHRAVRHLASYRRLQRD
jgi:DNA-binding transcriptional MerR regulator